MDDKAKIFYCFCKGRNPNCNRCGGKGMVDSAEEAVYHDREFWKETKSRKPRKWLNSDLKAPEVSLYSCEYCDKDYKTKSGLISHLIRRHCSESSRRLESLVSLQKENSTAASRICESVLEVYNCDLTSPRFECPKCDRICNNRQGVLDHFMHAHRDAFVQPRKKYLAHCFLCKRHFHSPTSFISHLINKHHSTLVYDYFIKKAPQDEGRVRIIYRRS